MDLDRYQYSRALAAVRGCDFAHPGEADAIDLLVPFLPTDRRAGILDFGCGLGGTAADIAQRGWTDVVGVDLDGPSIEHARANYPEVHFEVGPIERLVERYQGRFSAILAVNVLYLVADKEPLLHALRCVTAPEARLIVSDYVDLGAYAANPIVVDGRPAIPHAETRQRLEALLVRCGWSVDTFVDLTCDYRRWYGSFVRRIEARRREVVEAAGLEYHGYMLRKYRCYLSALGGQRLGGAVVVASRERTPRVPRSEG